MIKPLIFFCIIIFTACSSKKQETLAHIVERRMGAGDKLIISYQFLAGTQLVSDSMEVPKNRIIPHDSVKLVFSPGNPAKSHLILP
jgi:hypothetical protein